jgi:hypothetical protein
VRTDEAETETAGHLRDAFILKGCLRLSAHLLRETLAEYPMRFEIFVDEAPPPYLLGENCEGSLIETTQTGSCRSDSLEALRVGDTASSLVLLHVPPP